MVGENSLFQAMQRIAKQLTGVVGVLLIGTLLTMCSLGILSHTSTAQKDTQVTANCGGACHPHNQTGITTVSAIQEEDDDKEPVPLLNILELVPIDLALLYVAPVLTLVPLALMRKEELLSVQLRM